jgi:HD-GYP domain-containing protein (c-di-GMP phosphodiesterase class II)
LIKINSLNEYSSEISTPGGHSWRDRAAGELNSHLFTSASIQRLPQAVAATFVVIGIPTLVVAALRASGEVTSLVLLIAVAVVLSVGASYLGAAVWATRKGSGDVLFADLMLWGWVRRWRAERQLSSAVKLLGLQGASNPPAQLSSNRRVRLLERLAGGLEARYPDTQGHSRRVARHAAAIAKRMGLPGEEVARIRTAAAVHDVGKIETPAEIMNKPRRLTDEEFAVIKLHPMAGARMVAGLGDDELTRIVRHHHERLDGRGYPDGLSGSQIPVGARIVAVADTFDAITSTRPYRPAKRHREALEMLTAEAGTQLDPDAVRAFRAHYSGLRPVALWALFLNGSRQLVASLAGEFRLGGLGLAAKATAATVATVAAGGVAANALHVDPRAADSQASEAAAGRVVAGEGSVAEGSPSGGSSHHHDPRSHAGAGAGGDGAPESSASDPDGSGGGSESADGAAPADERSSDSSGSTPRDGGDSGSEDRGSAGKGVTLPDTSQVTGKLPEPVDTVVDTVARTVDSVPVRVPIPDVHPLLPRLPPLGVGGK